MSETIKVDSTKWKLVLEAIIAMQGHTFYCEDDDGVLRRWIPPRVPDAESK